MTTPTQNRVQNRVKKFRKQIGLSQQELANEIGVGRKTISDWERGKHTISMTNLKKLSQFFQVSMDDLLENSVRRRNE